MPSTTTYKRLVAVNMLHAWYLDTEQDAFYSLSATAQDAALTAQLSAGRYTLLQDLSLEPTPATTKLLKGHKMLYRQTAQGLLLGVAVEEVPTVGNMRYRPLLPSDHTLRLQFYIRIQDPVLLSRSNCRFNPVFPACYYFTNDSITTGKTHPSLSVPMQDFSDGRLYEMGETAIVNGIASQALRRTSSAVQGWTALADRQYISEYDRILLPFKFEYRFDVPGITEATVELKQGAEVLKTLEYQRPDGLQEITLNFLRKADDTPTENGVYTLTVAGDNNYNREYTIYLHNTLYKPDVWGVLDLVLHTTDPDFQLIDDDGLLVTTAQSGPPVLELRFLNRATYFKYYFQQKEPPVADPTWNDLPAPAGVQKVIMSKQPLPLMKAYRKINYDTVQLPNPDGRLLSKEEDRICSDVMLTRIKL